MIQILYSTSGRTSLLHSKTLCTCRLKGRFFLFGGLRIPSRREKKLYMSNLNDEEMMGGMMYHLIALLDAIQDGDAASIAQRAENARSYAKRERPELYAYDIELLHKYGW